MVLKIIFNNFIILMLSYMTLTMIYGYMAINLSSEWVGEVGNSIFNISFVWKFGMMSCIYAVALGVAERVFKWVKGKRGKK